MSKKNKTDESVKKCFEEILVVLKKHNCDLVVEFQQADVLGKAALFYMPVIVQKQKDK